MENTSNKTDYQKTLNLPQTDFAMKAGLTQKEPQMLARWQNDKIYQSIRQKAQGATPFILHDGPPYANGHIHIGHALNKILKVVTDSTFAAIRQNFLYITEFTIAGLPNSI